MVPAHWLLDHPTTLAVVVCEDPAEALARMAAAYGSSALHYLDERDPPWFEGGPIAELTIVREARLAWRFACAALGIVIAEQALGPISRLVEPVDWRATS